MKLGVFDSGIGGEAVAASLREAFSDAEIIVVNDREHLPYGSRTQKDIVQLTDTAIQPLLKASCDIIIIACNSATSAAIDILREGYPHQQFIGLEPMIKPATKQTKTGVVAVCATPATLTSDRYCKLKETYAQSTIVIEPDCSSWASMIEHDQIDELIVQNTIRDTIEQGADVIVLACTHYHWIRQNIESVVDEEVTVLEPTNTVIDRIKYILERR